jgi:transposase
MKKGKIQLHMNLHVRLFKMNFCRSLILGWRVYVSNAPMEKLSWAQAVLTYRDQWIVEQGFHRFRGKSLGAHPMFVHRDDQVLGLLNLLSLGLRLLTLIEFVVHRQLSQYQDIYTDLLLKSG